MAVIPRAQSSSRRLGILPHVQQPRSQWGETGRALANMLSDGAKGLEYYEAKTERRQREAERVAEIERRRIEREGQVLAAQAEDFFRARWNGSVQHNADGTTTEVPGIANLTWQQMEADGKNAADYYADVIHEIEEQEWYTAASPEVRDAMSRHFKRSLTQYGIAAHNLNLKNNAARIQEQNARIEDSINRGLLSQEATMTHNFDVESNYAALRKLAMRYGSAIENPEILDSSRKDDGALIQLSDLKLKDTEPGSPGYARMKQDYDAIVLEHHKNRITNLTRQAASDTSIGPADAETLIRMADGSRQVLGERGMITEAEDKALQKLLKETEAKMNAVRSQRQDMAAGEIQGELEALAYKIAPTRNTDGTMDFSKALNEKFDEESFRQRLDTLVEAKQLKPDAALKLLSSYQRLQDNQIKLSEGLSQHQSDKVNGTSNFPSRSNPDVYTALRQQLVMAKLKKQNPQTMLDAIEAARAAGQLSGDNYFSLWRDTFELQDEQTLRIKNMVFSSFLEIPSHIYATAMNASKRGTPSSDSAIETLLGSPNAEYERSGRLHDPNWTIEDVDAADALVEDYIRNHPGDSAGAEKLLKDLVKPMSDAARAVEFRDRIRKMRQTGEWSINRAFAPDDEER